MEVIHNANQRWVAWLNGLFTAHQRNVAFGAQNCQNAKFSEDVVWNHGIELYELNELMKTPKEMWNKTVDKIVLYI